MRGDIVIARTYGDKLLVRRIWDEEEDIIYITDDAQFELLNKKENALQPMAFHREDIFKFNAAFAKSKNMDWKKLKPY